MKRATKVWLIISACLIAAGLVISAVALVSLGFDFKNLSTRTMETNTYSPAGDFSNILVDVRTADITFKLSTDGKTKVVCYEEEKMKCSVQISDDTLVVTQGDDRKWYEQIGFYTEDASVTVYLPAKIYYDECNLYCTTGDVTVAEDFRFLKANVETTTGDIDWNANLAGKLQMKCTTGDMKVSNVRCGSLDIQGATADVNLKNTEAEDKLNVKVTTGDVTLDRVDAAELFIKATTGDVIGTLVSDKIFDTKATTGMIIMPAGEEIKDTTKPLGKCTIETTTGDIKIEIEQ